MSNKIRNWLVCSFNPLGRGVGIGGYDMVESDMPAGIGFNPLGRGVGIGGPTAVVEEVEEEVFQSAWTRRRYWGP